MEERPKDVQEDSRRTAYHEAGHMCAAWDLGLEVIYAEIETSTGEQPDSTRYGYTHCPREERVRQATWVDGEEYLYAHLVVICAGPVSTEFSRSDKPDPLPCTVKDPARFYLSDISVGDAREVRKVVNMMNVPKTELEKTAVKNRACREAESLIECRWECVKTVARRLMERKTLNVKECRAVLKEAFSKDRSGDT